MMIRLFNGDDECIVPDIYFVPCYVQKILVVLYADIIIDSVWLTRCK